MQQQHCNMTYFLEDVARYLMEKNRGDLQHCVIVFPGRRARLFFNHYLALLSDKPLWSPEYYTINDFVLKLSGLQLADQLNLLFRLFKIYKEFSGSNESFDSFYYYCEVMLADFDDIDKYKVEARQIFKNISDIRDMDDVRGYLDEYQIKAIGQFWDVCLETKDSPEKQKFVFVWNILLKIYTHFTEELERDGLAYEGMAYRKAVDKMESGLPGIFKDKQIIFAGFNALNYTEEILFDRLKNTGKALFFWDFDKHYIENRLHEAGFFLRKYLKKFPQPADFMPGQTMNPEQNIYTIAVPSNISQAKIIDHCLSKMDSLPIKNHSQTALILADEGLLLPVINSLPLSVDKVNISMGYPVIETPAFAFIISLVDLHRNKRQKQEDESGYLYYHIDFFNILRHGFLTTVSTIEEIRLFEKRCLEHNLVYIDPAEIISRHPILSLIYKPFNEPEHFGSYLRDIIEAVATEKTEGDEQSAEASWQTEVLYSIHSILMQFDTQLRESGLKLQLQTILNLLRKIIRGVSVPFTGEPLSGLQIMGILETRALDFENIVILSMNEGKFPKTGHAPSFIPYSLREGFGLPTIRHQDAIFAYYFYRLLHRSKNVILVYNTRSEGIQKGEPSRFILQLRYEYSRPVQHMDIGYKILPFVQPPMRGNHTQTVTEKLMKYIRPGGTSFLSPSAINTYLRCKLRFYYKYIEEIKEPENVEEQIETNVFGSILHKVMAILYREFVGRVVSKPELEMILKNGKLIEHAIFKAFGEEYFNKNEVKDTDFKGRNLIIRSVIQRYVKEILNYDSMNSQFLILSLEHPYQLQLPLDTTGKEVALGGYIDRLDEKEGFVRVIDYKTGEKNSTFQSVESLFSGDQKKCNDAVLQTFLYSLLVMRSMEGKPVQPSLFFVREVSQPGFDLRVILSENRRKSYLNDFRTLAADFQQQLINSINKIFNPDIPFEQTADLENCRYCPYNSICFRKTSLAR